jgi:hypothetical protein
MGAPNYQEATLSSLWCRIEYYLANDGGPKNSWETAIMTLNGPAYSMVFDTYTDANKFPSTYRIFSFQIPAGSTSMELRFRGRQAR